MRLIINAGILVFLVSIIMMVYTLNAKIAGRTVSGWTSLMGSIWMIGGIQLLCLGVIGEYIGKIYSESKNRPRYRIRETLEEEEPTSKASGDEALVP